MSILKDAVTGFDNVPNQGCLNNAYDSAARQRRDFAKIQIEGQDHSTFRERFIENFRVRQSM